MNRRHVDEEPARQGDVTRDARALLTERFLGDLYHHVLTGLQHFGDELRPARWAEPPTLVAAIVAGAAGTAGPAFEASAWTSTAGGAGASTTIAAAIVA